MDFARGRWVGLAALVLRRIRALGRGQAFTPAAFLDLGSRTAVDVTLHRLVGKGLIRRLGRGLYDYPKSDPLLGTLSPTLDAIIQALQRRDRRRLLPSGAYAANQLGLTEQVPMKVVLLTDDGPRRIKAGPREILLKRTTPRNLAMAGRTSGLLAQALRYLGRRNVTMGRLAHLRGRLSARQRRELNEDLRLAPAWMHPYFRALSQPERPA